jgi:DNA-binding NtrC family response regulator
LPSTKTVRLAAATQVPPLAGHFVLASCRYASDDLWQEPAARMEPMRILVVDGEKTQGQELAGDLVDQGHDPTVACSGPEALDQLQHSGFELVFADIKTPRIDGLELLRRIKDQGPCGTEVVLMSNNGSIRAAVEAVQLGALDFVAKPLTAAEIAAVVARVKHQQHCPRRTCRPPGGQALEGAETGETIDQFVIGGAEAMARVKHMIRVSARTDANVLIYGETGCGKDLIASVIHRLSHRKQAPLVKVGCTLFPESLIESELYGHEEGSFTGADQPRKGRFELAEGGTIYLDDVDDIPLVHQAKLLRAIEEKVFERVGGNKPLKANVRIVASSKKNLLTSISEGKFREDLYYRLDVLRIRVPPLRERRDDIPLLTDHLLQRISGDEPYRIDAQAIVLLAQHEWPGNVRELYHTLERTFLIGGGHITPDLIEAEMGGATAFDPSQRTAQQPVQGGFHAVMQHAEKQLLISALEACRGNKTAAASSLGMKPSTFRDKLAKHDIK